MQVHCMMDFTKMYKNIALFILLLVCLPSAAQYKKKAINFPDSRETDMIDRGFHDSVAISAVRVLYEHTSMTDTLARDNFNQSVYVLQIARNGVSLFENYDFLQLDSAFTSRSSGGKISVKDYKDAWYSVPGTKMNSPQYWKNYPEKQKQTFYNFASMAQWTYTQENPNFGWEIFSDSVKTVMDYPCIMAVGNYAGRKWKVWFSLDIPFSDGPWKLCGLPGLILMAEDSRGEFFFRAYSLQNMEQTMFCTYGNAFQTTRERYLKTMADYMANGRNQIIATGLVTGTDLQQSFANGRPYNPIELY